MTIPKWQKQRQFMAFLHFYDLCKFNSPIRHKDKNLTFEIKIFITPLQYYNQADGNQLRRNDSRSFSI